MLDDANPNPCSARMLRSEADYWRRMAATLDSNGDEYGAADLLAQAVACETIAARMERVA